MHNGGMTDRGYPRISLDTAASGSIDKQVAQIKRFAGDDLVLYPERSVSGSKVSFADRPEGGRLMADLKPGDRVLVTKIDRAARNVRDLLALVERIEAAGCSIVFVEQNIDTSGPMGRFILVLLAAIAELEASIIAERRRESLEQFGQEGRHAVGKAPYGFESVANPNGRGLVIRPHPIEGPMLEAVVEHVMHGDSFEKIAASIGLSKSGFSSLMRNPRLAGMTPSGNGVVTIDGVPRIDPDAGIMGLVEWTQLQSMLGKTKSWSKNEGIGAALKCGVCGDRLYFNASKRKPEYATYKCRGLDKKHKDGTPAASVIARNADAYVEAQFLDRFGKQGHVLAYMEDSTDARAEAVALARLQLQEVRRQQDAAITDEQEEVLMAQYLVAKRAVRDAEAMPSTRRLITKPTGRTLAEEWADADPESKVLMLGVAGEWMVQPGRLPIDQKIVMAESLELDMGKIIDGLTPLS